MRGASIPRLRPENVRRVFGLAVFAWASIAMLPTAALAQKGRAEVKEGNRLYAEGRYGEAHEKYLEALRAAPNSPLIRFNDGNALYQSQEFERAMEAYHEAVESGDPALEARAWYNLGNALYRQQQLAEALEAYKQALLRDPDDVDAKHNLELVLEQMQRQQRQQQQDQGEEEEQPEQQQEQEGQQESQDRSGDEGEDEERQQGQQGEAEAAAGQEQQPPQPQPGQMTREQAQRLLQAIKEDPGKIARKRMVAGERRKPKKDW